MKKRNQRLVLIFASLAGLGIAAALVLSAFRDNMVFFFTPTQVMAHEVPSGQYFRVGGIVADGSLQHLVDGVTVRFVITDTARHMPVRYRGVLPDLFAEGQGVVAQGRIGEDGVFHADRVLAKHDENYMPPEAAQAIRQAQVEQAATPVSGGAP